MAYPEVLRRGLCHLGSTLTLWKGASKVSLPLKERASARQIPRLRTKANKRTEPEFGILGAMKSSRRLLGPLQLRVERRSAGWCTRPLQDVTEVQSPVISWTSLRMPLEEPWTRNTLQPHCQTVLSFMTAISSLSSTFGKAVPNQVII